jgi:uncharacterized LabA/DUF88 family protein
MHNVPDSLTHERAAIFVDYHNTLNALRREGRQVDLGALRSYLAEGRHLVEAFLYIATHPLSQHYEADQATLHQLRQHGFLVRSRMGQLLPNGRLKCDFDLEMALDIQEFVARTRPDIVVLVSGDGDFVPLAQRLRLRGIRVEVASTPGSVSAALQAMANGFVDLTHIGQDVDNLPLPEAAPAAQAEAPQQPAPNPDREAAFEADAPIPLP